MNEKLIEYDKRIGVPKFEGWEEREIERQDVNVHSLYEKLKNTGERYIYVPDYIKENAKTRGISKLRKEFEELLSSDNKDVTFERASLIFITHGKKTREHLLKYYPVYKDYLISYVIIRSNKKSKNL